MTQTHSPKMLQQIQTQIRGPYTVTQLETLREYYQRKQNQEVLTIITQEIQRRKG